MSKKPRPAVIEAMEQRLLFDVSFLTTTLDSSTLPSAISDHVVLHGTVTVTVSNNSGVTVRGGGVAIGILISNGPLDVPSGQYGSLGSVFPFLSLADGQSKGFTIPINVAKGRLADGVDTLTAVVAQKGGGFSQSPSGGTLTVHPPIIQLSETETFLKLPGSAFAGGSFHVTDQVAITNNGTDPSTDAVVIGVYVTPDGIPADGTLMTQVTRRPVINAGKIVTVPVTIAAIPKLSVGSYKLITQITQINAVSTTTDPATAPIVTVNTPTSGVQFSDTILSDTPTYTPEPLDGALEYLSTLEFSMSIKNTGSSTSGDDVFTLFASPSPIFGSSAIQVGQVSLNLTIPHNGLRNFFVAFNTTRDLNDFSGNDIDEYVFIQVTDPTGNVTLAGFATPIRFAGLIV